MIKDSVIPAKEAVGKGQQNKIYCHSVISEANGGISRYNVNILKQLGCRP